MKSINNFYYNYLVQPATITALKWLSVILLVLWTEHAFAEQGDFLQGTDSSLRETLSGTGKKYFYIAEGVVSLAAYIKTKNLLVLGCIVVVSLFLNLILKVSA